MAGTLGGQAMRATRRGRAAAGALAGVLLAGGVTVVATWDEEPPRAPTAVASSPSPTAAPSRSDVLAVADAGPAPSPTALSALVDEAMTSPALAGGLAVSVLDAGTGEVLHERAADLPLIPASTAKIATAVAVLTALPADLRLTTRVVAGGAPGEVVLVGGGDPTLAGPRATPGYPQPARLAELARRVREALGTTPVTRVLVDTSLYSGPELAPGWKPTYVTEGAVAPVVPLMVDSGRVRPDRRQRSPDPALAAGRAFAELLQPGADVEVARGTAAADAALLGQVASPPVPALVERMLTDSDNDLAEALARQLALASGRPASFSGAAAALDEALAGPLEAVGADRGAVRLVDGSGLSREDRVEPGALTRLLSSAASGDDPRLAPVLAGLPVAGFNGTLGVRYRKGGAVPAAGVVRAKTGTLNGVSGLAGLVRTADGRLLAFDLTADEVPLGANRQAERALDVLAARIAACGCP